MNKVNTIIAAILLSLNIFAQSPEKISYQAVIRNSENSLVKNNQVGMQISILQNAANGNAVYVETQIPTTNSNGLVSIEIGTGNSIYDFSIIDWSEGTYFIKTETDIEGGTNYTITGVSQLLSVPFALYAKEAGNVPSVDGLATQQALEDSVNTLRIAIPDVSSYISTETDPVFNTSIAKGISTADTAAWHNKSNFSGNYDDLSNKPNLDTLATKTDISDLLVQIKILKDAMVAANLLIADYDGNIYESVTIGTQEWLTTNLRSKNYNDGTPIANVTETSTWDNLTSGAYCWYNNDELTYKSTYGALYNWHVVSSDKICPKGWHVPTDSEWQTLINYLGGESIAGGKLKQNNNEYWKDPNSGATNESGFSALPSGIRLTSTSFDFKDEQAYFWSSSDGIDESSAWIIYLTYDGEGAYSEDMADKASGRSIRCLKD